MCTSFRAKLWFFFKIYLFIYFLNRLVFPKIKKLSRLLWLLSHKRLAGLSVLTASVWSEMTAARKIDRCGPVWLSSCERCYCVKPRSDMWTQDWLGLTHVTPLSLTASPLSPTKATRVTLILRVFRDSQKQLTPTIRVIRGKCQDTLIVSHLSSTLKKYFPHFIWFCCWIKVILRKPSWVQVFFFSWLQMWKTAQVTYHGRSDPFQLVSGSKEWSWPFKLVCEL